MTSLASAIAFACAHENPAPRDLAHPEAGIFRHDRPPYDRLLGPTAERGPQSGVIRRHGVEIAAWGEPDRADYTFSVAKSYLAMLAGVAHDGGRLPDLDEPVRSRVPGIGFDAGRNAAITWRHLLQQTSEWEGEHCGVPDQVDRYRTLAFQPATGEAGVKGDPRPLRAPGGFWEYNDVRINQLSLALMHLFRRPLPEVFRESIARPCGVSDAWTWTGYDDVPGSWCTIDGRRMQTVPGGSHWGGGIRISARDQALLGQMILDGGASVLSRGWVEAMHAPCPIAPFYGLLMWLNGTRQVFPSAPATSAFMIGHGGNIVWTDPALGLVAVVRWLDQPHLDAFFARVTAAVQG